MKVRIKERPDDDGVKQDPPSGGTGSLLDSLRQEAEQFLAAGDEAINRALAGSDSEAFLRAGRQQGGE